MGADQRIFELTEAADQLADQPSGGWLARAVRDGIIAELEAKRPEPTPAEALADLVTSGLTGRHLLAALNRHFPNILRPDVFLGIALAAGEIEGRITLAQTELAILQAERGS